MFSRLKRTFGVPQNRNSAVVAEREGVDQFIIGIVTPNGGNTIRRAMPRIVKTEVILALMPDLTRCAGLKKLPQINIRAGEAGSIGSLQIFIYREAPWCPPEGSLKAL